MSAGGLSLRRAVTAITALIAVGASVGIASGSATASPKHGHHDGHHAGHHAKSKGAIDYGAVAPITGSAAAIGQKLLWPLYASVRVVNQDGGVMGHQINLVPIDDVGDPADAVPNVTRALTTHKLVAAFGITSAVAASVVPIINHAKVPMVSTNGLSSFNRNHYKYFWRLSPPDVAAGVAMGVWAANEHDKSVAVLVQNDVTDLGNEQGILAALKAKHITVVNNGNVTIPGDLTNYQSTVERLISTHPQAIIMSADTQTTAAVLSEYKSLNNGNVPPLIAPTENISPGYVTAMDAAVGEPFVLHDDAEIGGAVNTSTKEYRRVLATLKATPQVTNATLVAGSSTLMASYDGVIVMSLAMTAAHSTNGVKYNKYIPRVTSHRKHAVVVHSYKQGVKQLKKGHQIQFVPTPGPINFNKYHDSSGDFGDFTYSSGGSNAVNPHSLLTATAVSKILSKIK